jgi:hypothetical protein
VRRLLAATPYIARCALWLHCRLPFQWSSLMRNNHPKSENPAMKEKAASDKDLLAREKTTAAERAATHPHPRGHAAAAEPKSDKKRG